MGDGVRIALCSQHLIFIEIVAHVLARRGDSAVVIATDPADLLASPLLDYADVAIVDIGALSECTQELIRALNERSATLPMIGLVEHDADIESDEFSWLRPRAVCDKRQRINDLLDVVDRVVAGGVISRQRSTLRRTTPTTGREARAQQLARTISPRERQVLCGLVRGEDTHELARSFGISVATTRSHVQSILAKLGAHSRLAAVSTAIDLGLVDSRSARWQSIAADEHVG